MDIAALSQAVAVPAATQSSAVAASPSTAAQVFTSDDLLFMEVRVGDFQLAESMDVYSSRSGVFVPLGEFARTLDLAIGVFPAERRVEGWILSPDRPLLLAVDTGNAAVAGRLVKFATNQAVVYNNDIYVRIDLLEQLLPVKVKADVSAQLMTLTPTEPLPFQERLEREQRRAGVGLGGSDNRPGELIDTPYRLFTPPSFDVNVGRQTGRDASDNTGQFDVRMAGDLAFAGFQGFAGADADGKISGVRVLLERKDPNGRALGFLGGTRAGIGDTFTPGLPLGAGSASGRGVFYSSAPLESLDLSTPLNLRGELPLGDEVELYVNEVLQGAQTSPLQGRYEFVNVPLSFGLNTIRLVFYGPQSQKREEVRRINFGAGQIRTGRLLFQFGAVEQGRSVVELGDQVIEQETGNPRVSATLDYGINPQLTASAGFARFKPQGEPERALGFVGLRGSLAGIAAQINYAADEVGGQAASVGVAGRPFDVSIVGNHSEYFGGFIDETRQPAGSGGARLKRVSDVRADLSIATGGGISIPMSFEASRSERVDGDVQLRSGFRASAPINRFYVSTNVAYEDDKTQAGRRQLLTGGMDISTLVAASVQLRGGLAYQIAPTLKVNTLYASADFQLSEKRALRLGVVSNLDEAGETALQASHRYQGKNFDLSLNAGYEVDAQAWRVGFQLGFAFAHDPVRRGYRLASPGASAGGAVAVNAFVDDNGDRTRQADEEGVSGIVVDTLSGPVTTDKAGRASAIRLGDGAQSRIRLNIDEIDDPFLVGGPTVLEIVPRPGRTAVITYPMQRTGEVAITAMAQGPDGKTRPLSALNIQLVPANGGEPLSARSGHAGGAYFEGVRPGDYNVRLDPAQAAALKLEMANVIRVSVPAGGGFVRSGDVIVRLATGGL